MSDPAVSELQSRIDDLESQLTAYQALLHTVSNTCGQHNCNCPGSSAVKLMAQKLGATQKAAGAR